MKAKRRGMVVGGASLLVIFAVLCLTVFALLSLSTVKAQRIISEESKEAVEAYYEADAEAEAILAALRAGSVPTGVTKDGDLYVYSCEISETQALCVVVEVSGENYKIYQWKAVLSTDWDPAEYIQVWGTETED